MPADIALTPDAVNKLLQSVTLTMLGVPSTQQNPFYLVRTEWPTTGQPDWSRTEDICFVRGVEEDDEYDKVLDRNNSVIDGETLQQTDTRTRVWKFSWCLYGPNSFDRTRLIRKGLMSDEAHDSFADNNLYLIPDLPAPVRAPELFNSEWWERVDFFARFNELVTEYTTVESVASVEVITEVASGSTDEPNPIVSDITVSAP